MSFVNQVRQLVAFFLSAGFRFNICQQGLTRPY